MVLNKIGLTGGTGMLGRHVLASFRKIGAQVITTSRECSSTTDVYPWNLVEWLPEEKLDSIFNDVQAVVHVGAMVPRESGSINEELMFDANIRACFNLGEWAIKRDVPIVYVSGSIVYKDQNQQHQQEDAPLGWNEVGEFYGFSKLLGENVFNALCTNGLKLSVLRPSSIYGFGLPENKMINSFLKTAKTGGTIKLLQPVDDRVDLIHASDVSNAILKILKTEEWDTFNLSSGSPVSIQELAEACIEATGQGEVRIDKETSPSREPTIRFSIDNSRAKSSLKWIPKIDIKQGLSAMLQESTL